MPKYNFIGHLRQAYDTLKNTGKFIRQGFDASGINRYLVPAVNRFANYAIDKVQSSDLTEPDKARIINLGLQGIHRLNRDSSQFESDRSWFRDHGLSPNDSGNLSSVPMFDQEYRTQKPYDSKDPFRYQRKSGGNAGYGSTGPGSLWHSNDPSPLTPAMGAQPDSASRQSMIESYRKNVLGKSPKEGRQYSARYDKPVITPYEERLARAKQSTKAGPSIRKAQKESKLQKEVQKELMNIQEATIDDIRASQKSMKRKEAMKTQKKPEKVVVTPTMIEQEAAAGAEQVKKPRVRKPVHGVRSRAPANRPRDAKGHFISKIQV